jgi:hypothetical protein
VSEGIGGHGVSKASKKVSAAALGSQESFAGLMVPGGSGRHQLSILRRTDNVPNLQRDRGSLWIGTSEPAYPWVFAWPGYYARRGWPISVSLLVDAHR